MGFNPGNNVGRVSIRVVPDTTKFRRELKRHLDVIEKRTSFTVNVDKVNLDRVKIQEQIRRQLKAMDLHGMDAHVKVIVDKARLKKNALRRSIQEQFDQFDNIKVNIEAAIANKEHFEREVKRMADRASRNKVNIGVAASTAAASAHLRYVSRPRWVELFVKINKKSLVAAMSTLAALSGSRLAWKWIDDLIQKAKELDRNLPAILGWTTGITSLVGAVFAATSGLVGIGQGLFQILPAFLVLPGLLLNAGGSVTALIVALKNTGTELAVLKDDMHELGDIINDTFWGRAREPIVRLVKGLMPQLRNAFRDLSAGIGDFTAAMSDSFAKEFANGRLESIFKGIADGWRVLATGADGFAGAMVSLSNIAATYTPRLAKWFVRQANTFDTWLKAISTDGRLGAWMEDAIDSMYDLWDATRGVAGVFEGLWKAAENAGSGGLKGFAKLMLQWRKTVNSADFQKGLTAVFRGSGAAMTAFGDAIKSLGRLFSNMDREFETFIASAGKFLGGLLDAAFTALGNSDAFRKGLGDLSKGLDLGLDKLAPSLQPIADTFGRFIGAIGDLASSVLPAAAGVVADLMPAIDSILDAIRPVLPVLGDALKEVSKALAPAITDLVRTITPDLADALKAFAKVAPKLAKNLADAITAAEPVVNQGSDGFAVSMAAASAALGTLFSNPGDFFNELQDQLESLEKNGNGVAKWLMDLHRSAEAFGTSIRFLLAPIREFFADPAGKIGAFLASLPGTIQKAFTNAGQWLINEGPKIIGGFIGGLQGAFGNVMTWFRNLPIYIKAGLTAAGTWLVATGTNTIRGLLTGVQTGWASAIAWIAGIPGKIKSAFNGAIGWLRGVGRDLLRGLINGINDMIESVKRAAVVAVAKAIIAAKRAAGINSPSKKTRREIGRPLGQGVAYGITDESKRVQKSMARLTSFTAPSVSAPVGSGGQTTFGGSRVVNLNIHHPTVRDLGKETMQAAELAGVML